MPYTREQLIDRIRQAARSIGFPEQVAIAQLARESANFRNDVVYGNFVGGAGEKGLAQFIPGTWARFGNGMNPYDPDASLQAWAAYTSYLINLFSGNLTKVLQGYNGGEGNVQRGTVSSAAKNYAASILNQAGKVGTETGELEPTESGMSWLLIGGVALIALLLFLDD